MYCYTSFFCFGSNLNQFYTTMNNQLKIYCKWFNANKLSNNANKTNYYVFHKTQQNVYNDNLILNDSSLHRVPKTKFVRVIVQENLSWKYHCNYVCNKISNIEIYVHLFFFY